MDVQGRCAEIICCLADLFTKDRFFLPVFEHPCLGRDNIQFFLDLGEEGLGGAGFFFIALTSGRRVLGAACRRSLQRFLRGCFSGGVLIRQLRFKITESHFQFGLVKEIDLEWQFFAAGAKAFVAWPGAVCFFEEFQQLLLFSDDAASCGVAAPACVSVQELGFV